MVDEADNKNVRFEGEHGAESDIESEEESARQFNKFELLELVENNESQGNSGTDEKSDCSEYEKASVIHQTSNVSKNKRKKRRNKSTKSGKVNETAPQSNHSIKLLDDDGEYSETNVGTLSRSNSYIQLLKLDMRNLIPENELKRMFGKSVLKEEKTRDNKIRHHSGLPGNQRSRFVSTAYHDSRMSQPSSGPKMELDDMFNQKPTASNSRVLNNKNTKKNHSEKLKVAARSDTMQSIENQPTYYKFIHDKNYQTAHFAFLQATLLGHSESIVQNLSIYPTHIESLIQLSDMIRISEDYKSASDLIERALLIFERGFHQKFNMASANCRLSYRRPENRTFFIAIFKHIIYCNRRGLRRTPLEYTKLLLALDPENDPLFAALMIDFFSIRSEEYDYLIEFADKWKRLSKLPNMKFSLALAYFMKSRSMKKGKDISDSNLNLADNCLQEALIRYPNFIITLLEACSAEPDSELKKCDYFNYSVYTNKYKLVPESVEVLVNIYVKRSSMLWKNKHVLAWLEKNVSILVEKFAKKELCDEGQHLEYWSSFQGPCPRNLLRHIILSDLGVKIPPSAASSTVLDIDPFPPITSIISYKRDINAVLAPHNIELNQPRGISSLFIRSILPSFSSRDQTTSNHSLLNSHPLADVQQETANQATLAEQQLENNEETAINLERVQSSIQNVLSSLTNLLIGAEGRPDAEDQQENNQRQ